MELFLFCVLSLIAHVSGQSLMHVLSTNSALSTLYKVVNGSSHLTSTFSSLKNFTLLAPSDNAFTAFQLQSGGLPSGNDLTAFLQYHVLDGIWHASSWSNVPLFLHTSLDNPAYSNVTGGQNVELVLDPQQNPRMISGNKTSSSVTSTDVACDNGIIQIISEPLAIPLDVGELLIADQPQFSYFIAGLYEAGNLNSTVYTDGGNIFNVDATYFIPNSPGVLESFTALLANATTQPNFLDILEYHIVVKEILFSTGFKDGLKLTTANGKPIDMSVQNGIVKVNQATVTATDFLVGNGVVHVIDALLSDTTTAANSTATASPTASSAASNKPSSSGLSTGAKIGIGIGVGIVGLAALIGAALWFFKFRQRRPDTPPAYPGNEESGEDKNKDLQSGHPLLPEEPQTRASELVGANPQHYNVHEVPTQGEPHELATH